MTISINNNANIVEASKVDFYKNDGTKVSLNNSLCLAGVIDINNIEQKNLLIYNSLPSSGPYLYRYSDSLGEYNKIIVHESIRGENHITKIVVQNASGADIYTIEDINFYKNISNVISVFRSKNSSNLNIQLHENDISAHYSDINGVLRNMSEQSLVDKNTNNALFKKVPAVYISGFIACADGSLYNIGRVQ